MSGNDQDAEIMEGVIKEEVANAFETVGNNHSTELYSSSASQVRGDDTGLQNETISNTDAQSEKEEGEKIKFQQSPTAKKMSSLMDIMYMNVVEGIYESEELKKGKKSEPNVEFKRPGQSEELKTENSSDLNTKNTSDLNTENTSDLNTEPTQNDQSEEFETENKFNSSAELKQDVQPEILQIDNTSELIAELNQSNQSGDMEIGSNSVLMTENASDLNTELQHSEESEELKTENAFYLKAELNQGDQLEASIIENKSDLKAEPKQNDESEELKTENASDLNTEPKHKSEELKTEYKSDLKAELKQNGESEEVKAENESDLNTEPKQIDQSDELKRENKSDLKAELKQNDESEESITENKPDLNTELKQNDQSEEVTTENKPNSSIGLKLTDQLGDMEIGNNSDSKTENTSDLNAEPKQNDQSEELKTENKFNSNAELKPKEPSIEITNGQILQESNLSSRRPSHRIDNILDVKGDKAENNNKNTDQQRTPIIQERRSEEFEQSAVLEIKSMTPNGTKSAKTQEPVIEIVKIESPDDVEHVDEKQSTEKWNSDWVPIKTTSKMVQETDTDAVPPAKVHDVNVREEPMHSPASISEADSSSNVQVEKLRLKGNAKVSPAVIKPDEEKNNRLSLKEKALTRKKKKDKGASDLLAKLLPELVEEALDEIQTESETGITIEEFTTLMASYLPEEILQEEQEQDIVSKLHRAYHNIVQDAECLTWMDFHAFIMRRYRLWSSAMDSDTDHVYFFNQFTLERSWAVPALFHLCLTEEERNVSLKLWDEEKEETIYYVPKSGEFLKHNPEPITPETRQISGIDFNTVNKMLEVLNAKGHEQEILAMLLGEIYNTEKVAEMFQTKSNDFEALAISSNGQILRGKEANFLEVVVGGRLFRFLPSLFRPFTKSAIFQLLQPQMENPKVPIHIDSTNASIFNVILNFARSRVLFIQDWSKSEMQALEAEVSALRFDSYITIPSTLKPTPQSTFEVVTRPLEETLVSEDDPLVIQVKDMESLRICYIRGHGRVLMDVWTAGGAAVTGAVVCENHPVLCSQHKWRPVHCGSRYPGGTETFYRFYVDRAIEPVKLRFTIESKLSLSMPELVIKSKKSTAVVFNKRELLQWLNWKKTPAQIKSQVLKPVKAARLREHEALRRPQERHLQERHLPERDVQARHFQERYPQEVRGTEPTRHIRSVEDIDKSAFDFVSAQLYPEDPRGQYSSSMSTASSTFTDMNYNQIIQPLGSNFQSHYTQF